MNVDLKPALRSFFGVVAALCCLGFVSANAADITIGYSVPSMGSAFWTSATYGVEKEAEASGIKLIKVDAGSDNNVAQQIGQIQDLIQRHVNAIIIGAANDNALKPIAERAVAQGIPVIGFSTPPNTDKMASYIGADHYDMGRLQAECMGKAIGGKGKVAMMSFITGQIWADLRAKGFKETMAKEFPDVSIVAENRLATTRAEAITLTEDWIQRFPDLVGIYTTIDDMAGGVVPTLKAAKKSIVVTTSNLSPAAQKMIHDGDLPCTSIQKIVEQGRNALQQAAKAANKEPTTKTILLPAVLVTKENIDSVDLSSVSAPADYRP
jgi:ribose transport system substrate-binding protein/inositol transport system substrate-binding protein